MFKKIYSNILKVLNFFSEFLQDLILFMRQNGYSPFVPKNRRLFYKIIIETHTIEKGLSLAKPKLMFGKEKISFVMSSVRQYDFSESKLPVEMTLGALDAYLKYHNDQGVKDSFLDKIREFCDEMNQKMNFSYTGGIKEITGVHLQSGRTLPEQFLMSRSSCRMFQTVSLPHELIMRVTQLAQSAPSQCNRQSSKLHFYQDAQDIEKLLLLQGGSRGFSETVSNLFIVTSEVAAWGGAGQRNQLYVDGSLFAMNLLLSCHAMGLAACPLNLAIPNSVERKIRSIGRLPEGERVIMMIAVGYPQEGILKAASSPRRAVAEVLQIHGSAIQHG